MNGLFGVRCWTFFRRDFHRNSRDFFYRFLKRRGDLYDIKKTQQLLIDKQYKVWPCIFTTHTPAPNRVIKTILSRVNKLVRDLYYRTQFIPPWRRSLLLLLFFFFLLLLSFRTIIFLCSVERNEAKISETYRIFIYMYFALFSFKANAIFITKKNRVYTKEKKNLSIYIINHGKDFGRTSYNKPY